MVGQLEIPLPEITKKDFKHVWTRFELVARAKEWDEGKQLTVIQTLRLANYWICTWNCQKKNGWM